MKKILFSGLVALTIGCQPATEAFHFDEMTYSPAETVFRLFAPADARCSVLLEQDSLPMTLGADSIWTATAKGNHKGKTYQFLVNGLVSPGVFAKAVTVNGEKGVVIDMRDTDPEGWQDDHRLACQSPADLVVYELHHRDFSIGREDAKHPGKFLALTEPWAIDHLKMLGVNAVHILPSYDFGSVDETRLETPQYNWGYDPVNYNVPEGSYATDPYKPEVRLREFKQMVQALHRAGIRVILDVVYNHTYDIEHSNFQRTYPDYYYRVGSNGSGCGNETASEKPMMRLFMTESVKYWMNEYHIDGFRFDLMGCHDIETMNFIRQAVDTIDPSTFIYGEGWSAGQCALPVEQLAIKANITQMPRIAAFSDELRDALRGPFSDDTKAGWLGMAAARPDDAALSSLVESLKFGIVGAISHPQVDMSKVNYSKEPWATEPTQMMAYVSCHDDMCLTDRLRASIPRLAAAANAELVRLDLLAQTVVLTSQGVPFILSGEELLRTKQGVHNSFESPDSVNRLDWQNKERYPQVFKYYSDLIALRHHHPAFRLGAADLVRRHLEFLDAPRGIVAYRLKDHAGGDPWRDIFVMFNACAEAVAVTVPDGRYTVVCREGVIDEQSTETLSGSVVTVAPQSALILYQQ
jgi:pullulanase